MDLYFNHAPQKTSSYIIIFSISSITFPFLKPLLTYLLACLFLMRIMLMMLMIFTCFCYVSNSRHFQHKRRLHIHNLSHLSQFHFSETTTSSQVGTAGCCSCFHFFHQQQRLVRLDMKHKNME